MITSCWIESFEKELELKKIVCLYGNIEDDFYYEGNIENLEKYLEKYSGENIFDLEYFEKIANQIKESREQEDNKENSEKSPCIPTGYANVDPLLLVDLIQNSNKKYIIIRDPKLFFADYTPQNSSHSLRYLQEFLKKDNEKKVIIISKRLADYPEELLQEAHLTGKILIDYPEEEIRKTYLRDHLGMENDLDLFTKISSKRTLKELENMIKKAEKDNIIDGEVREIINNYDHGKKSSPWTEIEDRDILNLEELLKKRVKGQETAINFVKKVLVRAKLGINAVYQDYSSKPIGIMFFIGPSGVGKTELAKALTEVIFGDEKAFRRFDMSEYKEEVSVNKLIGSSPGYVGYEEGGQLTNCIMEAPFSVILFDEIEKAHPKVWDTFLQVLEDGRLTDNKGNTGYFNESILIFTSNIGNKEVQAYLAENQEASAEEISELYIHYLQKYFIEDLGRVEILNRFGNNIVPFNQIDSEDIFREIIDAKLKITGKNLEKKLDIKIIFENLEELVSFFIDKTKSGKNKFGGRYVLSLIETYLINEFALFYLESRCKKVNIYLEKGEIKFRRS